MSDEFGHIRILEDRCKGCYLCISVCPKHVLEEGTHLNVKGIHPAVMAHPENCIVCRSCAIICPDLAIEVYEKETSPL